MWQKRFRSILVLLGFSLLLTSCKTGTQDQKPQDIAQREIAHHIEEAGEGNIVTKIFETRQNGIYTIKIQVIKGGKMQETVHHFDSPNFSISIPVSANIIAQDARDAKGSPDANVTLFSQSLEAAREAMVKTDYIAALEALNSALQIDSFNPQAHMMKGSIFYAMGKVELAKKEFDFVLKVDPGNIEVKRFQQFLDSKPSETPQVKFQGPEDVQ